MQLLAASFSWSRNMRTADQSPTCPLNVLYIQGTVSYQSTVYSIHASMHPSIHPSNHPSIHPSIHLHTTCRIGLLETIGSERSFIRTIKARQKKWIGHTLRVESV